VSNIGKIEWIESDTISCKSMDYAKMLIVTKLLSFIENQFLLQLKDYQYKIGIIELENHVRVIPCFYYVHQGDKHRDCFENASSATENEVLESNEANDNGMKESDRLEGTTVVNM
jgi:hypothetical protein